MELILSRPGAFNTFATEWQKKWVPAVMTYCTALKKKEIADLIAKHKRSATSGRFQYFFLLFVLYVQYVFNISW